MSLTLFKFTMLDTDCRIVLKYSCDLITFKSLTQYLFLFSPTRKAPNLILSSYHVFIGVSASPKLPLFTMACFSSPSSWLIKCLSVDDSSYYLYFLKSYTFSLLKLITCGTSFIILMLRLFLCIHSMFFKY